MSDVADVYARLRVETAAMLGSTSARSARPTQGGTHAMLLEDFAEVHRPEVVECAIYATPNFLKSQAARKLKSPFSNICAVASKLRRRLGWR